MNAIISNALAMLAPLYYTANSLGPRTSEWLAHDSERSGRQSLELIVDYLWAMCRYGVTYEEYVLYKFSTKASAERGEYVGVRWGRRFIDKMSSPEAAQIIRNKLLFNEHYRSLISRPWLHAEDLGRGLSAEQLIWSSPTKKAVAKSSAGHGGTEVHVLTLGASPNEVRLWMTANKLDLLEGFIVQHPDLDRLSPSAVNTLRIMTHFDGERVHVVAARLRISRGAQVDNSSAGGLMAYVDLDTGTVRGPATSKDPLEAPFESHPISGLKFDGFAIPHWRAVRALVDEASSLLPSAASVAWDIALAKDAPELIEGNIKWGRIVLQVPAGRGLKKEFSRFSAARIR